MLLKKINRIKKSKQKLNTDLNYNRSNSEKNLEKASRANMRR